MKTPETLLETILSDRLFRAVSGSLPKAAGPFYACGEYILEAASGQSPGGMLVWSGGNAWKAAASIAGTLNRVVVPVRGEARAFNIPGGRRTDRNVTVVETAGDVEEYLGTMGFTALCLAVRMDRPEEMLDPLEGMADIEEGVLRATSRTACLEDAARALLAADLAVRLDLEPDDDTMQALRDCSPLIGSVERGRAWLLFSRFLEANRIPGKIGFMARTGLLKHFIPELEETRGVPQNYYHHLGVWEHTMEVVDGLELMMDRPESAFKAYGGLLEAHLLRRTFEGVSRRAFLALAGLLHDIGKPACLRVEPSGRIRFTGHHLEGARKAAGVAERLGLGRKGKRHLAGLVANHMRLTRLMEEKETVARRMSLVRDLGDITPEVVMLSMADIRATRGEASTEESRAAFERMSRRLLSDYYWDRETRPLIDGNDVLVHSGTVPGPRVDEMLLKVRIAQRECIVNDRRQALEYLSPDTKGRPGI